LFCLRCLKVAVFWVQLEMKLPFFVNVVGRVPSFFRFLRPWTFLPLCDLSPVSLARVSLSRCFCRVPSFITSLGSRGGPTLNVPVTRTCLRPPAKVFLPISPSPVFEVFMGSVRFSKHLSQVPSDRFQVFCWPRECFYPLECSLLFGCLA